MFLDDFLPLCLTTFQILVDVFQLLTGIIDKTNNEFDIHLYKVRHLVENLFARLKQFRSIATRYDKSKNNYASLIYMGCSIIWGKI